MYILLRALLYICPIVLIIYGFLIKNVGYWWQFLIVLFLFLLGTIFAVCKFKLNKDFLHFLILPVFFVFSGVYFMMYIINDVFYYIFIVVLAMFLYALLKQYYLYFYFPFKYQPYSLESLSLYISWLTAFFIFSGTFAGLLLLQLPLTFLISVMFVSLALVVYQFFWINKINFNKGWLFILIILLIIVELFIAISFLPNGYYVDSFVLGVALYILLGLSKAFFQEKLNSRTVAQYVIVGGLSILLVLLTARWS